jgi:hypothetical protein
MPKKQKRKKRSDVVNRFRAAVVVLSSTLLVTPVHAEDSRCSKERSACLEPTYEGYKDERKVGYDLLEHQMFPGGSNRCLIKNNTRGVLGW